MTVTAERTSDVEFLGSLDPDDVAPSKLARTAEDGDVVRFVERLRKWLPETAMAGSTVRTEWSHDPTSATSRTRELADLVARGPGGKRKSKGVEVVGGLLVDPSAGAITDWLDAIPEGESPTPIETLLLAEAVLEHGRRLAAGDLWRGWRQLVEGEVGEPKSMPLVGFELHWLRGLFRFDEAERQEAAWKLEESLLEATDTDGTPEAAIVADLDRWIAPLLRCQRRADDLDVALFTEEGFDRLHDLVEFAVAALRVDGTLPFGDRNVTGLLEDGVAITGWSAKSPVGRLLADVVATRGSRKTSKPGKRRPRVNVEPPSVQSDWAHVSHLRADWSPNADSLLVEHGGADVALDLAVLGYPLLTGTWGLSVSLDGEPVAFDDRWDCVCWFTDEEVDYVELQFVVDERTRIERQLLLPRGDRFAVLADAIATADGVTIDYESRLPLAAGLEARADVETRECTIHAKRKAARVFPLALPQDRVNSASGWFGPDEGVLRLERSSVGGLYAPVVLDWAPERSKSLADWTMLTVTEAGRSVGPESAAGARVRVGNEQLLLYRSHRLAETARAVLGLHTPRESVIGRVPESGDVETLLLVD